MNLFYFTAKFIISNFFTLLYLFEVGSITKKWMGCWKETLTDADNFAISFPEEMELPNKERHQLFTDIQIALMINLRDFLFVFLLQPVLWSICVQCCGSGIRYFFNP
jgi:hypothetical protein